MNVVHLQTFIAIVETGSLLRASVRMNVTQSTVTARLKTLEESLGQTLLNRDKSGATLTPAGAKFLRYARMITGLWRQARRETALPEGLESMCTLGCEPDLWDSLGARTADLISRHQPHMALTILRGSDAELDSWMAEGLVDLILTHRASLRSGQTVHELPSEDLVLFATRRDAPVVGNPDYIFVDHGEEFRALHGESYFDAEIARVEFTAPAWALDYMLAKGGLAYLQADLANPAVCDGRLFEVADAPRYTRKRFLVVRDNAARNWTWFGDFAAGLSLPSV